MYVTELMFDYNIHGQIDIVMSSFYTTSLFLWEISDRLLINDFLITIYQHIKTINTDSTVTDNNDAIKKKNRAIKVHTGQNNKP